MAYRLKFAGRAVREVGEAFDWYEKQSKGLGSEFELAFELQLKRLEQVPLLYAEIMPGVRRTLLPRFPYGVFYTVRNDLVHVLAVIHNARNPQRWPNEPTQQAIPPDVSRR
jgi:plasmid stabilization system protein ParE